MNNPLKGKKAVLLRGMAGEYFLRLELTSGEFKDYDLKHNDFYIIIDDDDHNIYTDKDGNEFIDHSYETLGYERK